MQKIITTLFLSNVLCFSGYIATVDIHKTETHTTSKPGVQKGIDIFAEHQLTEEQLQETFRRAEEASKKAEELRKAQELEKELVYKPDISGVKALQKSSSEKTDAWFKQIQTDLNKPGQTESTKTRAVKDYQYALQEAAKGMFDPQILLTNITAKGGLLTKVIADAKTKTSLLNKEFLKQLSPKDMIDFAEKMAEASSVYVLNAAERKAYQDTFNAWMKTIATTADVNRVKQIKTRFTLEQIRQDLAQPGQTEVVRQKAVNDYRTALQEASNHTYNMNMVLDFLTPQGGLLDAILKIKDIRDGFLNDDFMDDVAIPDLIVLANKLVQLGTPGTNKYDNFYERFITALIQRTQSEKNLTKNNKDALEVLRSRLPKKAITETTKKTAVPQPVKNQPSTEGTKLTPAEKKQVEDVLQQVGKGDYFALKQIKPELFKQYLNSPEFNFDVFDSLIPDPVRFIVLATPDENATFFIERIAKEKKASKTTDKLIKDFQYRSENGKDVYLGKLLPDRREELESALMQIGKN